MEAMGGQAAFKGITVFKSPVMLEEWIALDGFAAKAAGGDGENKNGADGSGEPVHTGDNADNADAVGRAEPFGMAMIAPMSIVITEPIDPPVWWDINIGGNPITIDYSTLADGALVVNLSMSDVDVAALFNRPITPAELDAVMRALTETHFTAKFGDGQHINLNLSCTNVYYDGSTLGIQFSFSSNAISTAAPAAIHEVRGGKPLDLTIYWDGRTWGFPIDVLVSSGSLLLRYNGSSQHPMDIFPPVPPPPLGPPLNQPSLEVDDPLVPDEPGTIDNPLDASQPQLSFEQTSPFFAESLSGMDEWVDIPPGELNDWPAMGWEELDNPGWDNVEAAAALHQARLALGRLELSLAVLRDQGTDVAAELDGGELAAFGGVLGEGDAMHARLAGQIGVFEDMIGRVRMIAPGARDGVMADLFESGAVGVLKAGHAADAMAGGIDAVTSLLRDGIGDGLSGDAITTAFAVTYAREQEATEAAGQRIDREDAEFNAHQARQGKGEIKL